VPIVPGILPLTNFAHAAKMAKSCNARFPTRLARSSTGWTTIPAARTTRRKVALAQCRALYALGIRQFHFYTLNRAELVLDITRALPFARARRSCAG
jgi:methylenetetrahydrofolate reductase (NADPH)